MTEKKIRAAYEKDRQYFEWLGVSETEYINDHREGTRLARIAKLIKDDESQLACERHSNEMIDKYDWPLAAYESGHFKNFADWEKRWMNEPHLYDENDLRSFRQGELFLATGVHPGNIKDGAMKQAWEIVLGHDPAKADEWLKTATKEQELAYRTINACIATYRAWLKGVTYANIVLRKMGGNL